MKKIILLACCIMSCLFVKAQVSAYVLDPNFSAGTGTIVRSWGTNHAISYYETTTNRYIDHIVNGISTIYRVEVPEHLFIYDIFIDNDIAYFCGSSDENITYSVGMMGYFHLNDLFSSNVNFHYVCITGTGNQITRLNKLVEYNDGSPHVVAVAEAIWVVPPIQYSNYCIVDCPDISMTPYVYYDYAPLDPSERYFDMVLTDNLVVFTGYYANYDVICIRKCDKGMTFGGIIDTLHAYDSRELEVYSKIHATPIKKDEYAISYLHIDSDPKTRIRVFDAATSALLNSEEFITSEKAEPKEMIYVPFIDNLLILEYFLNSYGFEHNFVYVKPLCTTSYNASIDFIPGKRFNSLSVLGIKQYVSGIGTHWLVKDASIYPTIPTCPMIDNIRIDKVEGMVYNSLYMPLSPIFDFKPASFPSNPVDDSQIIIQDCAN